jgi:phosphatidate cytidylyltransferase
MTSSDEGTGESEERRFVRPWEIDEPAPAEHDQDALEELEALADGPSVLDTFTNDDYLAATTREYQGLAEEIARAQAEDVEQQAVAASIPGVGSGLIGFDDVTGVKGVTEEEMEAVEQARASDLTLRVGTAVVLVGIFLGSLVLGPGWFTGFVVAVMILALGEFYATTRTKGYSPVALFGFLGVMGAAIGTLRSGIEAIGVSVIVTTALVGVLFALTGRKRPLENSAITVLGAAWVSLLAFAIGVIKSEQSPEGLILFVVLVTAVFDIGSYFAGRGFGRRLMARNVSPKKTWEGYIGGTITAVILASILSTFKAIFPLEFVQSVMVAVMISIMAPTGDLAESVVKRAMGVKDMGSLLPGHGGMLDRIDALLFVIPAAYMMFHVFGLL